MELPPCNEDVFKRGIPILAASTGDRGGNLVFEAWVQSVAKASGQPVDWHYSGGRAQVLALGDLDAVRQAAATVPLPAWPDLDILVFFAEGEGLVRHLS